MTTFGIIGLGFGASVQIPALITVPEAIIVSVSSSSPASAKKIVKEHKQDWAVQDWKCLVKNPEIDAVIISAPPAFHYEMVMESIKHSKHILCEKPFGVDAEEAKAMFLESRVSQRIHFVDYGFRMDPYISGLRDRVKNNEIGNINKIQVNWLTGGRAKKNIPWSWQYDKSAGGGTINAFASHVIDYVEWVSEKKITSVFGQDYQNFSTRIEKGYEKEVTAEDSVDFLCKMEGNIRFSASISNTMKYGDGHQIDIFGEKGRLRYIYTNPHINKSARLFVENEHTQGMNEIFIAANSDRQTLFKGMATKFIGAIKGRPSATAPDFETGARIHTVLSALKRSCSEKREIPVGL